MHRVCNFLTCDVGHLVYCAVDGGDDCENDSDEINFFDG